MKAQRARRIGNSGRVTRKSRRMPPKVLLKDGRPAFVVLDIRDYREMLGKLEDLEDIQYVDRLNRRPRKTRPLEEYLAEREAR